MLKRLIYSSPADIPDTAVVSLTSLGVIGESLRAGGVRVHILGMSSALSFPLTLLRLTKLIRQYQPTIVQTWMYHADFLGGLAARLAGCRNVVWGIRITSVPLRNPMTVFVMKICALLSYCIPCKIVCVAEAARREHIRYGYDASRMVVVHNGFDFTAYARANEQRAVVRDSCNFSKDDLVVGWVGRFHPDKGQDNFVKAAAIVSHRHAEVKYLLVGRNCDVSNSKLMGWLNKNNLKDRFALLGERDDVPACLAAMDVFCMPSRNEGFPNGLGEAMAIGLPCVVTDVGDAGLLVGDTAVLVPAQDAQALASGLLNVISLPPALRIQIGLCSKTRVMKEFSIARAKASFDDVYRDILRDEL